MVGIIIISFQRYQTNLFFAWTLMERTVRAPIAIWTGRAAFSSLREYSVGVAVPGFWPYSPMKLPSWRQLGVWYRLIFLCVETCSWGWTSERVSLIVTTQVWSWICLNPCSLSRHPWYRGHNILQSYRTTLDPVSEWRKGYFHQQTHRHSRPVLYALEPARWTFSK